ncbi:MAG TPA: hypothetical protein VEX64_03625 [Pyrinomonadaceae bacterium]|nr:hypothetical protein [Pyrinomonadaceae bacterium]
MISISDALEIIEQNTPSLEAEHVALADAVGRVLADEIYADMDLPPFNRSQMDGYAVKSDDTKGVPVKLRIAGESAAGKGWKGELKRSEAVRIMTGAPVPAGADAVQKVEVTNEDGEFVEILKAVKAGENIVERASEIEDGEKVF